MSKTLGIYQFIRNATKYDYPFEESILSAIPIADQIVICECFSDDDTYERVLKLQAQYPEKITIIRRAWVKDFRELSVIGNYCVPFLDTDWVWQLQADEVIHDDSYEEILNTINTAPKTVTALIVKYVHFLANYATEFDFNYKQLIRIARKGTGWQLCGDACHLDKPAFSSSEVLLTNIQVYHYGKVHEGKIGYQKEWDFQQLFTDIGFPDPKMEEMKKKFGEEYCDYVYLFESSIKEGKVREFKGTHPKIMEKRIAQFKENGWEQFVSKMKEGLKI